MTVIYWFITKFSASNFAFLPGFPVEQLHGGILYIHYCLENSEIEIKIPNGTETDLNNFVLEWISKSYFK
jgi:hypothetical protein